MIIIDVQTTPPSRIYVGEDLLQHVHLPTQQVAVITDQLIENMYGKAITQVLDSQGVENSIFSFPPGEINKTRATKEYLEDKLLAAGWDKQTTLIGLGGGVVTDIAGFIASSYYRGIPFIAMPTTLMGMVDAAIGGKNGVNTPLGKNLIGTIYQPHAIFCDIKFLQTLPKKEFDHGWMEMVKHGLIADAEYYYNLKKSPRLVEAIERSCLIKKSYIERDPDETNGLRKALNFGHTVGHALEALSHYTLPHGEAIAFGMAAEAYLSWKLGLLGKTELTDIIETLTPYFTQLPADFNSEKTAEIAKKDKKAVAGKLHCTLLKRIGECAGCLPIEQNDLIHALQWLEDVVCNCQRT